MILFFLVVYSCFFFVFCFVFFVFLFFFQAEDGIRDLVRSRGLGDVYKRQEPILVSIAADSKTSSNQRCAHGVIELIHVPSTVCPVCLLYTSDAADERSSVDLGGRRIIKKKKNINNQ